VSSHWHQRARGHLDSLTKPLGSLGMLEDIAARLVAIQETSTPSVDKKAVFVFAADHGVTAEGVSAYPQAVTEQMVLNFLRGGAAINVLSRLAGAEITIVDVGVDASFSDARLLSQKVRRGSRNMLAEPALADAELSSALGIGSSLAEEAHARGIQLVAVGEMGIGNTTAASAITAALTGADAEQVTGHGTGVQGEAFLHKQRVVRDALALHFPNLANRRPAPLDVLRCVGGLEIAAIAGFIRTAAQKRLAIVIDGFISTAAAAIACQLDPATTECLFAGHQSCEMGHMLLLELVGQRPILGLDMRLGEGTGAVLAFSIIEAAARIYNEMATFASAGVSEAIQP